MRSVRFNLYIFIFLHLFLYFCIWYFCICALSKVGLGLRWRNRRIEKWLPASALHLQFATAKLHNKLRKHIRLHNHIFGQVVLRWCLQCWSKQIYILRCSAFLQWGHSIAGKDSVSVKSALLPLPCSRQRGYFCITVQRWSLWFNWYSSHLVLNYLLLKKHLFQM